MSAGPIGNAGMHRAGFRVAAALTALVVSSATTSAAPPQSASTGSPLKPMSRADLRSVQVLGTGCFWSYSATGPTLLAMVEDRAAIRTADGIVILSPGPNAKEMFPFTHDRWRSADGRITIAVRQTGEARMTGEETLTSTNVVDVVRGNRSTKLSGVMQCGS